MNNEKIFTGDEKFKRLSLNNQQAILKLDKCLEDEGYVFNGNWRDDCFSGGSNSSLRLINEITGIKNLVTLRPIKSFLKVEIYWGYSRDIPPNKKPKEYYKMHFGQDVPIELVEEKTNGTPVVYKDNILVE